MTDKEIIKAYEDKVNLIGSMTSVYLDEKDGFDLYEAMSNALALIRRKNPQLLKEQNKNKKLRNKRNHLKAEIERLGKSLDKTIYKLEYLLCYATGSKLSKHTYELKTMYGSVNDYIQKCCEQTKAEAVKEFAKKMKGVIPGIDDSYIESYVDVYIDNLVKEMIGETK